MDHTADNIRALRNMWGESQEDLALAIGLGGKTTICNYETGGRNVQMWVLRRIADHYWVTEDVLTKSDLSDAPKLCLKGKTLADLLGNDFLLSPIVKSEEAMEDPDFAKGIEYYQSISAMRKKDIRFLRGSQFDSLFDRMFDSFEKAYERGVVEAGVNLLAWLFTMAASIRFVGGREEVRDASMDMDAELFFQECFLMCFDEDGFSYELDSEDADILAEIDELAREVIRNLNRKKMIQMAGFLKALRFYCGTAKCDDFVMCMQLGVEMISAEMELGNRYAKRFYRLGKKFLE